MINDYDANSLPADIARCDGVGNDTEGWREGCENCLRRTSHPANSERVVRMQPPAIIVFECEYLLEITP